MSKKTPAQNKRLSRGKRILFIAIAALLVPLLAVLTGEIYFRAKQPYIDPMQLTGSKPAINAMSEWAIIDAFAAYTPKSGKYPESTKTVNSHGFISTPELTRAKADGEIRIVFLGESSTAGTGFNLADDETWPWKTTAMLLGRFPGKKITFINAAAGGYSSFESYGRLWSRIRFYKPDIVVANHGWNEMYYFSSEKHSKIERWRTLTDRSWSFDVESKIPTYSPSWTDHVVRHSQFLIRVRLLMSKRGSGEAPASDGGVKYSGLDPAAVETFRGNLQLIAAAAKIIGADLFICKQATMAVQSWTGDLDKKAYMTSLHGFGFEDHLKAYDAIYSVIDDEIPLENIIDLTVFSGRKELFFDHVHPTPDGTTEFARIVSEKLAPALEKKFAPTPISQ